MSAFRKMPRKPSKEPQIVEEAQAYLRERDIQQKADRYEEHVLDRLFETVHIENAIRRLEKELERLAEKTEGETRLRLLMAQRAVLDAEESFIQERDSHGEV